MDEADRLVQQCNPTNCGGNVQPCKETQLVSSHKHAIVPGYPCLLYGKHAEFLRQQDYCVFMNLFLGSTRRVPKETVQIDSHLQGQLSVSKSALL